VIVLDSLAWQASLKVSAPIGMAWLRIIEEWVAAGRAKEFVVLIRGSNFAHVPGETVYTVIPEYRLEEANQDRYGLQSVCDQLDAELFLSSYYTTPLTTPSLAIVYDLGISDTVDPHAREKMECLLQASGYVCFSDWVANELKKKLPGIPAESIAVVYPGIHPDLKPESTLKIRKFREDNNLGKSYILFRAGRGVARKEAFLNLIDSLAEITSKSVPEIVYFSVEGSNLDTPLKEVLELTKPVRAKISEMTLPPDALPTLYSGALALVEIEPDRGLGSFLAEVMRCGCPVILLAGGESTPEELMGGAYPWFLVQSEPKEIAKAIQDLQNPTYRNNLSDRSVSFTRDLTWKAAADKIWDLAKKTIARERLLKNSKGVPS